ncbi:MAG: hypothetical protein KA914_10395 [Ottowia sp.]|jgi:hypothetical protein|nr:hypothetical protein [Ottowia sp.]
MTKATPSENPVAESSPTLSHVIGKLTVSKIWAFVLACFTAFAATATGGFALGSRVGEMAAQERMNALSAQLSKAAAEAIVQTERSQQVAEKLKQFVDYSSNLNVQVVERDKQIATLNERLGRASTCDFLQQQIAATQQQIFNISNGKRIRGSGIYVLSGNTQEQEKLEAERKAQDDAEIAQLQQRVLAFTQQLSACAK